MTAEVLFWPPHTCTGMHTRAPAHAGKDHVVAPYEFSTVGISSHTEGEDRRNALFEAEKSPRWQRGLWPYLVKPHRPGFEGGLCLGCGPPAVCPDPGGLAVSRDPLCNSLPCSPVQGSWCPSLVACRGRWMNLEWIHKAPGWPEGRLLSCVNHCHQKCLSHGE